MVREVQSPQPRVELSPREKQVLRHVRTGSSNKEIAETLHITERAVKAHVSRLLLKFRVSNRTTLASVADRALGARHQTAELQDALARSRELRDYNRELVAAMRRELRDFRVLRRKLENAGGGIADWLRRNRSPPNPRPP